jgi:hypothetical protein
VTRPDLAPHASAELATRDAHYPEQIAAKKRTADEAGRALAAWRAIVALLEHGQVEPEACFPTLQSAWDEIKAAIDAAIEHRASQCRIDGGGPGDRLSALREIRSLVIRSAARQGAHVAPAPLDVFKQKEIAA